MKLEGRQKALIVGASRGLGFGLVEEYLRRGWQVQATTRSGEPTDGLRRLMAAHPGALAVEAADINQPPSVEALRAKLAEAELDLLFVNAGISRGPEETVSEISTGDFIEMMVTNALGPMRVITALLPAVRADGTVAVMSSGLASVANNTEGRWEVYRASKASLNTFMRSFAARHPGGRSFLCISPGWVRTDMGGEDAPLDVATSVQGIARTVEARAGSGGVRYIDYLGENIPW